MSIHVLPRVIAHAANVTELTQSRLYN